MLHTSFGRSLAMIITCALLLVVSQPLTMLPKTTLAQEATIAINPTHGTPGTHVTVTGACWPSGWSVPIGIPPPPPPTLRTLKVWTADSRNKTKTSFAPGDAIRYMVQATNSGRSTVTARVIFLATGPQQIFSWSGPQAVVSGTPTITLASNVPSDAQAGTYTLMVTVTYNGVSSQGQSQFLVATSTPTWSCDPGNNRGKSSSVSMGDYREPDGKQYDN